MNKASAIQNYVQVLKENFFIGTVYFHLTISIPSSIKLTVTQWPNLFKKALLSADGALTEYWVNEPLP